MKSVEIKGNMDSKRKLLMSLFWTNRKAVRTEGCAQFVIEKITTNDNLYESEGDKYLKLSDDILNDILENIESNNVVEFDIKLGEEDIKAIFEGDVFSVSTTKTKELEDEIIEKLEEESKRKYPNICFSFPPRVGIHKYP
ncbi:MAG: hypothetical protein HZC47_06420 [Methanobacterium sp.]|uniref:hypothetical protein n=1 Tax=Methanobacterium sp. TaxID=2164 RepID=UPI003D64701B|nr:hypothetical protein [Methanobacterium sp.]